MIHCILCPLLILFRSRFQICSISHLCSLFAVTLESLRLLSISLGVSEVNWPYLNRCLSHWLIGHFMIFYGGEIQNLILIIFHLIIASIGHRLECFLFSGGFGHGWLEVISIGGVWLDLVDIGWVIFIFNLFILQ
jgi:hypothetical protein